TQVDFHPSRPNLLVSAAEDGLVHAMDVSSADDDECLLSTLNVSCPVRRFGFFGPRWEGVACLSTVETFSAYHQPSMQQLLAMDGFREANGVDYLVDALALPPASEQEEQSLVVLAGKYD